MIGLFALLYPEKCNNAIFRFIDFELAYNALAETAKEKNFTLKLENIFYQRNSKPVYTIFTLLKN